MSAYRIQLGASIDALKYLSLQGLASRGHDESMESLNRGNFLELLKLIAERDDSVSMVVFENAPQNCQMIAPSIQKDIINSFVKEITKRIIKELDGGLFAILADESADVTDMEQLALCLRYVDRKGMVKERFFGIVKVSDTTSLTLKTAIESLLMTHSLTLSSVRAQGYDGASNMRGSINGLKTLVMKESPSAYYIHCFAHKLQLTLVAVSKNNDDCAWMFDILASLLNLVGGSPKRKEILRKKQAKHLIEALSLGELESGSGLNQDLSLSRPGDTRWGSHYKTIMSVLSLVPTIIQVLPIIGDCVSDKSDKFKADSLSYSLQTFDFVFAPHLMRDIFGITNNLNLSLQRKEQDIVKAMGLVKVTKAHLHSIRDGGFDSHMDKVASFCAKIEIHVPDMQAMYVLPRRSKRGARKVTNDQHFRVEVFLSVIDHQMQELGHRFDDVNQELLLCMSCLKPSNRFSSFDKPKLLRLAKFYPNEFSSDDLTSLEYELENFVRHVRDDESYWSIKDLNELSMKLVQEDKHKTYPLVYLLLKLVLLLPVATASVERAFSAMTYIKNKLRNSMGDQLLHDSLVVYLERDLFLDVSDDDIVTEFQNMRARREEV